MPDAAKFAVADAVRVKPGVTDPDYPDFPLGGWRGSILRVWDLAPPLYLIQWSGQTLDSIHPTYRERCQSDGFVLEEIWLSEDELEADPGGPLFMEPPKEISEDDDMLTLSPDEPAVQTQEPLEYPAGTVAFFGPDDRTTTKIVAGVVRAAGAAPIFRRWPVVDFDADLALQQEMQEFFRDHGVKSVAIDSENRACPHEEGRDFPTGGDCPFCPWWKGRQRRGDEGS
jgi:hypothetical protein